MRKVIAKGAIVGLIRSQMTLLRECGRCEGPGVRWKQPDDGECNWRLTRIVGKGCIDCLGQLAPLVASLQISFDIEVPPTRVLNAASPARSAQRRVVPMLTRADASIASMHELIDTSKAAIHASRAMLRLIETSMRRTDVIRSRAELACIASRELVRDSPS